MIAVVPVRAGELPLGGAEAVAEAGGRAILAGDATAGAAAELATLATDVRTWEAAAFRPGAWAAALAPLLAGEDVVVLPASPDGRDLAPRLAHALGRPLLAGAIEIHAGGASVSRWGGLVLEDVRLHEPFVATLQPGVRGVDATVPDPSEKTTALELSLDAPTGRTGPTDPTDMTEPPAMADPDLLEVLPPDPATMDLAEAERIVAGGAGLDGADRFGELAELATALGASLGATRVVTDRGWVPHERQIGTTGVVVDPRLYLAFGISGAVQHTSGLGRPDHVVSVNTDPSCPMMQLADLAVVADANAVLAQLLLRLGSAVRA